jgi:hypothetical protein
MGKVDQLNDAVDHGVTKGDQRIDAAPGEPAQKKLEKIFHFIEPSSVKGYRPGIGIRAMKAADHKNQGPDAWLSAP